MKSSSVKSFFKSSAKPKSPAELVRSILESLQALSSPARDAKSRDKTLEDIGKDITEVKIILYGDTESHPNAETVAILTAEVFKGEIFGSLIKSLPLLKFDSQRDVTQIVSSLQRQQVHSKYPGADYLATHPDLVSFLLKGYEDHELALFYGSMLRDCCRHQAVASFILSSDAFWKFFEYAEMTNFEISSDATATFQELLTKHKSTVAQFLEPNFDRFVSSYNQLLGSSNYVTRRFAIKLLADILLDRHNSPLMLRYISSAHNLQVIMNNLKDTSKSIQVDAFHVFKVFVANEQRPADVSAILQANQQKLLRFLEGFSMEKGAETEIAQFQEDKAVVMKIIQGL